MCTSYYIQYTCGCEKEMEFVQCPDRQGTNMKCKPVRKEPGKDSANYCRGHLVNPDFFGRGVPGLKNLRCKSTKSPLGAGTCATRSMGLQLGTSMYYGYGWLSIPSWA